jgi:hypothetical protein
MYKLTLYRVEAACVCGRCPEFKKVKTSSLGYDFGPCPGCGYDLMPKRIYKAKGKLREVLITLGAK